MQYVEHKLFVAGSMHAYSFLVAQKQLQQFLTWCCTNKVVQLRHNTHEGGGMIIP
jgi:hypothetical protein